MKIDNIKTLQKVIQLCHKNGVHSFKIDGIEFHLTPQKQVAKPLDIATDFPEANIKVPAFNGKEKPTTAEQDSRNIGDELSQEQLLMWSVDQARS